MPDIGKVKPSPLSPTQVANIIREALGPRGYILPSRHFWQRADERDFTMQDAVDILEGGTIAPTPEWNDRTGTWNYDIHGTDIEGDALTVRVAVADPQTIILVTAF